MRPVLFAILGGLLMCLAGCATSDKKEDPDNVTSIPWNRPERWEGRGPFGGMGPGGGRN
jgi:hypothetical protein